MEELVLKTIRPLAGKGVGGERVRGIVGSLKELYTCTELASISLTVSAITME